MPVVYFTLPLSGLLVFALVLGLGAFLTRRFKLGWSLFWIGGAVFVLSQVLHIPFNAYILPNLIPSLPEPWAFYFLGFAVGLSSGVFEEGARYLMYRFWTRNARTWKQGVLLGAGHGGVEALFIGGLILWTAVNLWALRGQDLNLILSPEQASLAQRQIASLETLAWYETLADDHNRKPDQKIWRLTAVDHLTWRYARARCSASWDRTAPGNHHRAHADQPDRPTSGSAPRWPASRSARMIPKSAARWAS
jgi:hypothetical protein